MVYVIALISILLGAFAQYFLKVGMNRMNALSPHTTWELVQQMLSNLSLWGGISCYGLSMLFWLYVLSRMELSRAYPLVSLGYVFTLIIGYYLLGESISIMKLLGVALIIGGVFCISQ